MRKSLATLVIALFAVATLTNCGSMRLLGHDDNAASTRDSAAKALNMTTQAGVAIMTLAGAAYDAGAWGPPGSPRAEDVWGKLSSESVRLATALTAWADALDANKDTGPYQLVVATALAVITALLPPRAHASLGPNVTDEDRAFYVLSLSCPDAYREGGSMTIYGGSR